MLNLTQKNKFGIMQIIYFTKKLFCR